MPVAQLVEMQMMRGESNFFSAATIWLCGVAVYDVIMTIGFDIDLVRGKRRQWHWTMPVYFLSRLSVLVHILTVGIYDKMIDMPQCVGIEWPSKVFATIATLSASVILLQRARIACQRDIKITIFLVVLLLGQAGLWLFSFKSKQVKWNDEEKICEFQRTLSPAALVALYAYTMVVALVVLSLTTFKLYAARRPMALTELFKRQDGVTWIFFAFAAYLAQTILAALSQNQVMNISAFPLSTVLSVISAAGVYRGIDLASHSQGGNDRYPSGTFRSHERTVSNNVAKFNTQPSVHRVIDISAESKTDPNTTYDAKLSRFN